MRAHVTWRVASFRRSCAPARFCPKYKIPGRARISATPYSVTEPLKLVMLIDFLGGYFDKRQKRGHKEMLL